MAYKDLRSLRIESLENRRVLSAGPISADIQLVSFDTATGIVSASQNDQTVPVIVQSHPAARHGVLEPFLSGDFSSNGLTDLLAKDATDDSWWLQLNDGTQLFELPVAVGLNDARVLGTADFNQDQQLDVASIDTATNEIWISVNDGPNGFTHNLWGSFPSEMTLDELHIGDFSGDGLPDILAGQLDGSWQLAVNQGDSSFETQEWGMFPDFEWQTIKTGNFNGDAFTDVVGLAPDNTWWLWQGSANGFGAALSFGHWKTGSGWQDIGVGDFTGDGVDDVIGRTPDGKLHVGTSELNRFNTWIWGTGWIDSADWTNVSVIDLNDDGLSDQVSQAKDGTWWYAFNEGGSFSNHFWQRASDGIFVVSDFVKGNAEDVIDAMPEGGVDVRNLEVSVSLNSQNRLEIQSNLPVQIEALSFQSASGSLVPRIGGGAAQSVPSEFEVTYGNIRNRLPADTALPLDVSWNEAGAADLVASITIGSSVFPIQVPASLGPATMDPGVTVPVANAIYYNHLPVSTFRPIFETPESPIASANTISLADAKLQVERNQNNRIVLKPTEALQITGVELRSQSGSLIPLDNQNLVGQADPFLNVLVNSPTRIVLDSEQWPLSLSSDLILDIGWLPNSTASDLIVEYRVSGETTVQQAFVAAPLRLPFADPTATATGTLGSLGPVRTLQS